MARSLGFYGDGISFRVVFGQSFYLRVFPGGALIAQPRWMLVWGILGSGRTHGVSFRPFPNSSGWWRLISSGLISSVFFIRISCHKTTHANGYYGAWPGCVVSISVLSLIIPPCKMGLNGAMGPVFLGSFRFSPTRVTNTRVVESSC